MGFIVDQVPSCRYPPAGFVAIDILHIEAGFFLFTNECRISPSIGELGVSALLEDSKGSPEIQLVACEGGYYSNSDPIIWRPTSLQVRRPDPGKIMVTSARFCRLFDCAIGLGFVTFDQTTDVMIDPHQEFYNVKLCPLLPMIRIKQGLAGFGRPI